MNRTTRIILIVAGVLLVLCMCGALALAGFGFFGYQEVARAIVPTIPAAITPLPDSERPGDLEGQMDLIERQVSAIRGWTLNTPLSRNLQTTEELREQTIADFAQDYPAEEVANDVIVLSTFGLLPKDFDLYSLYIDLFSEGILGYYEPDTKEIYVISDAPTLDAMGLTTYAHEFQHALQDANIGIDEFGYSPEAFEEDSERAFAAQAMMEGEAVLVESLWMQTYFTQADYNQYLWIGLQQLQSSVFDAPQWIQDDLTFPYVQGAAFMQALYEEGGWDAIDAAYADPPVSAEMILHRSAYDQRDLPHTVTLPDVAALPGAGYSELDADVMGEWYLWLILREYIDPDLAASAAAGWGGDAYSVVANDAGDVAMMLHVSWDRASEARQFASAFDSYAEARFYEVLRDEGDTRCWATLDQTAHCLQTGDDWSRWVAAPTLDQADLLLDASVEVTR